MTYLAIFLWIFGCAVAAAAASWVVGRYLSVAARRRHHAVGSAVFQAIGVMIAVLLAFVFSDVWGEYPTAGQAINGECGALHGAAMLALALPDHAGDGVDRAIADYARAVTVDEWPMMADRMRSPRAAARLEFAMAEAARIRVDRPLDVATAAQVEALLAQAHGFRETRIFEINQAMPPLMWAVLILISMTLIAFVVFAGTATQGHMTFAAAYTACTVAVLVLVRTIDYPFEGALAIRPDDFVKTFAEVSALVSAPSPDQAGALGARPDAGAP